MLSEYKLQVIRDRKKDHLQFHNVLLAQQDRRDLLAHIDYLNAQLTAKLTPKFCGPHQLVHDRDPLKYPGPFGDGNCSDCLEILDAAKTIVKGDTAPHHPRGPGKH